MFKTRRSHSDLPLASRIYSSADVARIASVSLRQLQWWDERQVVSPAPRRPQADLSAARRDRDHGHRRIAPQRLLLAENSPGLAIPAARNGKTPRRRALECLESAFAHRRQVDFPGRSAGPNHRSTKERSATDVPGLRERLKFASSQPSGSRPAAKSCPDGEPPWPFRTLTSAES